MNRHGHRLRALLIAALAMTMIMGQLAAASAQTRQANDSNDRPGHAGDRDRIPQHRIGVQMWTYGSGGAIEQDGIEAVIAHMAEVGMRNIERYGGTFGVTLEEYAALFEQYDVRPVASHGSLDPEDFDEEMAEARLLNQRYIGSGGFGPPGFGSLEDTLATAENLNELGRRARRQGLRVYGHNHDQEFTTMYDYDVDGDGDTEPTPVIEILLNETNPKYVAFEIDIHWARVGLAGGRGNPDLAANINDPSNQEQLLEFLDTYKKRIEMLHVKDTAEDGSITDVGQGTTDWVDVFLTADRVEYYFSEYDGSPHPYESAEIAFEYMANLRLENPPADSEFQKVTLNDSPGEPMDLAVLPDGSVLHVTRPGEVWHHDADTGVNSLAATLDVYQHDEEGLQSIALDPDFDRRDLRRGNGDNWVYMYYSPPLDTPVDDPSTPDVNEGDAPAFGEPEDFEPFEGVIRLSRFRFVDGEIDLSTEEQILDVPVDRGICCHVGGDILFDAEGDLYLTTGDDTNPFESGGYTPIDERPDRNPAFDAQRTASNTNDLRGKVLRITPTEGGGYTIPDGNLFPEGTDGTRPEIYAMGFRNPFRAEIDPRSGDLYVGDYSPDAQNPNPERGPSGTGRWLLVEEPGNYGWPYCATDERNYVDYDFATDTSGEPFDCDNLVNESPNNTGLTELPPLADVELWYSYGTDYPTYPDLETGGIGPMGGPAYDADAVDRRSKHDVAWPEYYDGKPLFYEWTRDYIKAFTIEDGEVVSIEPVVDSIVTDNPMDIEFGPNGALYMLEYGDGFFSENPDAELSRIDYIGPDGNHAPEVEVSADTTVGAVPLTVQFTSDVSDADGDRLRYAWDFDGDGDVDSRAENPAHTYDAPGVYLAHLTVTDRGGRDRGKIGSDYVEIVVGNEVPVVEFIAPTDGDTFTFGDTITYEVQVTDDQPVDCDNVQVTYVLGHDEHGHPQSTAFGCSGSITTTLAEGHDPEEDDLSGVFVAEYTDPGVEGVPPLTGSDQVVLEPTG